MNPQSGSGKTVLLGMLLAQVQKYNYGKDSFTTVFIASNGASNGRWFIYFMDEFWKWLDDEAFSDFARNKQYTIRKQNGLGVFATQSPS